MEILTVNPHKTGCILDRLCGFWQRHANLNSLSRDLAPFYSSVLPASLPCRFFFFLPTRFLSGRPSLSPIFVRFLHCLTSVFLLPDALSMRVCRILSPFFPSTQCHGALLPSKIFLDLSVLPLRYSALTACMFGNCPPPLYAIWRWFRTRFRLIGERNWFYSPSGCSSPQFLYKCSKPAPLRPFPKAYGFFKRIFFLRDLQRTLPLSFQISRTGPGASLLMASLTRKIPISRTRCEVCRPAPSSRLKIPGTDHLYSGPPFDPPIPFSGDLFPYQPMSFPIVSWRYVICWALTSPFYWPCAGSLESRRRWDMGFSFEETDINLFVWRVLFPVSHASGSETGKDLLVT